MASQYHFTTRWVMAASSEEVYRTLEDVESLTEWWPSVYLQAKVLEKGRPGGVGKRVALHTKGWLPYTIRWAFLVTRAEFPNGFALEAEGDFNGTGVWSFRELGDGRCEVLYDWNVSADKPLFRRLSWLLRPVFSANHHWAMRKGAESLKLELLRRSAKTPEERLAVPPPPPPTWLHRR